MRPLRDAWTRVRDGAWASAQCGLAAALAWLVATDLLGHERPFFASVAAVVALGLTGGGRLRRTAELAAGVAVGVAVGDLWVGVFGQGTWQIGVVVTSALLVAVAVNGGGLAVTQAAVQACFVVALPRTPNGGLHRWQDALVGGALALAVAALLPADPWKHLRRTRTSYLCDLGAMLRDTGQAVRDGSSTEAAEALARGRALEPLLGRWEAALVSGRETSRITPFRRSGTPDGEERLLLGITRATRNLRVLVRRVMVALESGDALPGELPALLDRMADVVDPGTRGPDAIPVLREVAARLDPQALGARNLSGQVVVGQLRVAVVDLLQGLGVEHEAARDALPVLPS